MVGVILVAVAVDVDYMRPIKGGTAWLRAGIITNKLPALEISRERPNRATFTHLARVDMAFPTKECKHGEQIYTFGCPPLGSLARGASETTQ